MFKDLVLRCRSYRRFDQSVAISRETLEELLELARLAASGANHQPLKYLLYHSPQDCAKVFETLAWAGALKDWAGPEEGEQPTGYVVIVHDTTISHAAGVDHGIAAQNILLGAVDKGLGGCMLGAINRKKLRANLELDERYEILLVVALGKPAETVVVETVGADGQTAYWRDERSVHHVPKRALSDLMLN